MGMHGLRLQISKGPCDPCSRGVGPLWPTTLTRGGGRMAVSRRPPPPSCPPPPAPPDVSSRAKQALAAAAARQKLSPETSMPSRVLDRTSRKEHFKKELEEQGRKGKDVSHKIAEVLAAARQRRACEPLSPREELKRRAEQALKAAKYRGASPETRKRYEVEQAFGDRASKALSEALARQSGDPAAERVLVGAPVEQELAAWDSVEYHMPEDIGMWDEAHYADPEFGHWMGEVMEVGCAVADPDSSEGMLPEECYNSVAWVQDTTSAGYTRTWGMEGSEECAGHPRPSIGSSLRGANHSQWASKRHGGHARTEESEVRAWAETTTAASSNRSVASAADSNSETGQVHEDADDDADELLASCFRSVTGAT
ncbi:unnamed protein product [Symbiodinium necroappetens]|uniref:Uncharacterized protein n=1 Tax=Symbiodinium necroappetens TaxID=1628268 RepID=A0A812ITA6_9DINO|nr:unnamed protein product [Symbiodinium necroappetens]